MRFGSVKEARKTAERWGGKMCPVACFLTARVVEEGGIYRLIGQTTQQSFDEFPVIIQDFKDSFDTEVEIVAEMDSSQQIPPTAEEAAKGRATRTPSKTPEEKLAIEAEKAEKKA
jgi:hypothetical protein